MEFNYNLSERTLEKVSCVGYTSNILCNSVELMSWISEYDIIEPLHNLLYTKKRHADFKSIKSRAKNILSRLPNLGQFKHMILETLWSLTIRIISWRCHYASKINGGLLQRFVWTNKGRIDSKATAKYIIKNERITITKRFALACSLCLEYEIIEMWKHISSEDRKFLSTDSSDAFHPLTHFWTNKFLHTQGSLEDAYYCAVKYGLIDAVKYLFYKFRDNTESKRAHDSFSILSEVIQTCFCVHEDLTDVGYFLLDKMNENHKNDILESHLFTVLTILLYPPGQNKFLNVFKDKLSSITEHHTFLLLKHIICKINLGVYFDYQYIRLIFGIFKLMPEHISYRIKQNIRLRMYFCELIDEDFRILLTKNPSKKSKKSHILATRHVLNQEKWNLLLFFVKNGIVTTDYLKSDKTKVLKTLHIRKSNRPAWVRLMMFVNENGPKKHN